MGVGQAILSIVHEEALISLRSSQLRLKDSLAEGPGFITESGSSGLMAYRINVRPTQQEAGDDTQGCI